MANGGGVVMAEKQNNLDVQLNSSGELLRPFSPDSPCFYTNILFTGKIPFSVEEFLTYYC